MTAAATSAGRSLDADDADDGERRRRRSRLPPTLRSPALWLRVFHVALFVAIFCVTTLVLAAIVAFQVGSLLLTGQPNANLLEGGRAVARYQGQILLFLTFNTEERPYPFAPWPAPRGRRS